MKTIEIINLWDAFKRVANDPALTSEEKIAVGEEVLNQLPLPHLMASRQASIVAVERAIRTCLTELEKQSERSEPQDGAKERQGKPKTKQPLRKAEPDA